MKYNYKASINYEDFKQLGERERNEIIDEGTECGAGEYYCWIMFNDLFVDVRVPVKDYMENEVYLDETGGPDGGPWAIHSEFNVPKTIRDALVEKIDRAIRKGTYNVFYNIQAFFPIEIEEDEEDASLMVWVDIVDYLDDYLDSHEPKYKEIMKASANFHLALQGSSPISCYQILSSVRMLLKKKRQREEAAKRLRILQKKGLHGNVLKEFLEDGTLNYSENIAGVINGQRLSLATLYWVSNNEEMDDAVKKFEKEKRARVYHVIESHTEFGKLWSFLYVSNYEEEWEADRMDLEEMYPISYVHNCDFDEYSEIGRIGIQIQFGGIRRTD